MEKERLIAKIEYLINRVEFYKVELETYHHVLPPYKAYDDRVRDSAIKIRNLFMKRKYLTSAEREYLLSATDWLRDDMYLYGMMRAKMLSRLVALGLIKSGVYTEKKKKKSNP